MLAQKLYRVGLEGRGIVERELEVGQDGGWIEVDTRHGQLLVHGHSPYISSDLKCKCFSRPPSSLNKRV